MRMGMEVVMVGLMTLSIACDSSARVGDVDQALRSEVGGEQDPGQLSIVNGSADLVDPAVVALTDRGQQFCTGTLVAPQLVVTAAHCLPTDGDSLAELEVFFGNDVNGKGLRVPVLQVHPHPSWPALGAGYDIGTVIIPPVSVPPIELAPFRLHSGQAGESVKVVGFGVSAAGGDDHFVKQSGFSTIDAVEALLIRLAAAPTSSSITCNGDSGGPALLTRDARNYLVGVHVTSDCESHASDVRIDIHRNSFIELFRSANGECTPARRSRAVEDDGDNGGAEPQLDPDCGDICATLGGCYAECDLGECPQLDESIILGCAAQRRGSGPGGVLLVFVIAVMLAKRRRGSDCQRFTPSWR